MNSIKTIEFSIMFIDETYLIHTKAQTKPLGTISFSEKVSRDFSAIKEKINLDLMGFDIECKAFSNEQKENFKTSPD